jgi:ankyrin repeat protein
MMPRMKAAGIQASLCFNFLCVLILFAPAPGFNCRAQTRPDQETIRAVFQAIDDNDTNALRQLHASNTNCADDAYYGAFYSRHYPLLQAAADGRTEIVVLLLEYGADPNVAGDTRNSGNAQMTALDEAAQHGQLEVCKLLLQAGANPNHRAFQDTTLHFALNNFILSTNRNAVATVLLEYGANPFAEAGYYQTTPLELAITKSDGRLVPLMLNTDRKIKSASNNSARSLAASTKEKAAHFVVAHGAAMLAAAAQRGELEAVAALLKAGVSARTNAPGDLPVMQAFAVFEADAVKSRPSAIAQWQQTSNMISRFGPNANPEFTASIRSQEAEQAARVAAFAPEHLMQIRDLLIKNGADYDAFAATAMADTNRAAQLLAADKNVIQARDHDGQTPLHWAVLNDQLPLTSFWLQAGASPAATNFAGQTPLHLAATKGLAEQVKLLLAANAPADIRDTNGWTPLDAAIQAGQSDCIHLLMAKAPAGAHLERGLATPLHEAADGGNVAALAGLLETETNLEVRDELALTPLQVAVLHGHLAAAALLVDKGADVNVRDPDGNTLLHQILLQDRLFIYDRPPTNWLARVGQDPGRQLYLKYLTVGQYEQGPNPLLQAAGFLLASGGDATATNHAGETAMQLITDEKMGRGVFFFGNDRTELLQLLGAHGGNVDARDADGNTAMHRLSSGAYDFSKVEQMASLIASGADVNATNNLGQTPLHVAADKIGGWDGNNPPVNEPFQLLIYSKANVNAQDDQGLTPLDVVALSDSSFHTEATRALLDAGANPNLRDKQGRSPAHLFLSGQWPWSEAGQCIDMLVATGADLSAKDDRGKTPLHYLAALGGQNPMFFIRGIGDTFVLAKVDFNARDNAGDTPLHVAARTGTQDVYEWLVKQGGDPAVTNNAGETPRQLAMRSTGPFSRFRFNADTDIFQAVREGKLESVAAILKSAPDLLNQTNQFGQTPLLLAAQTRRTNIVDFLDAHGVRWDPVSAILTGRTEVLRKLIAQQPRLAFDASSLRLAVANGNVPAVEILLAAGADVKTTGPDGFSPLGIALMQHHDEVAELLVKYGATKNLFDAVCSGDAETAAALIDRDKSLVSATNAVGVSLAEIAAACGNEKTLKLLLDKGVSPNFQSPSTGKSLLYAAAAYDQTNTAQLLLQHHARLDAADNFGLTPLHVSALRGSVDVLELLLADKADCNQGAASPKSVPAFGGAGPEARQLAAAGNTALHLAALASQTNVIVVLLKWGASVNSINSHGQTPLDLADEIGGPPFLLMQGTDMHLPIGPLYSSHENPMLRRDAAIALLEQAGGKHGQRPGPAGMTPFGPSTMTRFPPMSAAPAPQLPVLQTGADYHDQGCADYNSRRFTNALADFRKSCELGSENQDYSYFRIWLIRARLGEKAAAIRNIKVAFVQADEVFSYIFQKPNGKNEDDPNRGSMWTFLSIAKDEKLIINWRVAKRTGEEAREFLSDLGSRMAERFQLTTDSFRGYVAVSGSSGAVKNILGDKCDYATETKHIKSDPHATGDRIYFAPKLVKVHRTPRFGSPDMSLATICHCERTNLSLRTFTRRFVRRTINFSKKTDNHRHAVALFAATFNFCRVHKSLAGKTPAMAAGLTDHVWTVAELLATEV